MRICNVILLCLICFVCSFTAIADDSCFLVIENNQELQREGECKNRYAPQSTFKIPLSLIGFDSGLLTDANRPSWPFKDSYDAYINVCKGAHSPKTWMRDSCLWYSRVLTTQLGMEKFQNYVTKFSYGNKDLSGDVGENNGLTQAWVSSSLKISPEEQVRFLQKLIDRRWSIHSSSYDKTRDIMFIQELPGGWKLYGKTGNGRQIGANGQKLDLQHGWFVGYIEKGNRHIVFVSHIVDDKNENTFASFRARNKALIQLWYLIDRLEA